MTKEEYWNELRAIVARANKAHRDISDAIMDQLDEHRYPKQITEAVDVILYSGQTRHLEQTARYAMYKSCKQVLKEEK